MTSRNQSLPRKGLHVFIPINPDVPASPDDIHRLQSQLAAVITIDPECYITVGTFARHGLGSAKQQH